jgi:hypothetical protein
MALRSRANSAVGGPHLNDSNWDDNGESLAFAAFTNAVTAQIFAINILPMSTSSSVSGGDAIPFGDTMQRLQGGLIAFPSFGTAGGVAASTISTLGIAVYHNFGTLGTQITNAGGALTSLTIAAPGVSAPMPSGQTFNITIAAGGTSQVWTTSAAVAVGALTIPVTSTTPSSTYAIGTPLAGQLGNNIAFGWLNVGGTLGTPAFRQNASILMPAMTAVNNPALNQTGDPYGPYLPMYPGDMVAIFALTSSSTFAVPTGIVTTMAS